MEDNRSLTPTEVAEILKITKHTVYEMVKRGDIPAYRIGRKMRIDPKDVELYRRQGKSFEFARPAIDQPEFPPTPSLNQFNIALSQDKLVISGQDIILDILARHLEQHLSPIKIFRYYVGSFEGLSSLYHGKTDMAAVHLLDGDSGKYNLPYVRHLLPGIPVIIIHLAQRMQGFYVPKGNPKDIKDWLDLKRPDIIMLNREAGSGTRVLLDEKLRLLKIDSKAIRGYEREEYSHLVVAGAVARGEVDVALGNEKASLQVRGVDFIPLQKESYDLVITKNRMEEAKLQTIIQILQSPSFRSELLGLGDYDLSNTGQVVADI
ncbi:MAG: helix-turn-helix transcriptional regulator [Syntrophomonadaceae bacterium]|nr:helix-turn-helix transcriptional regulator [Syntrophomonadaceae bacterium]